MCCCLIVAQAGTDLAINYVQNYAMLLPPCLTRLDVAYIGTPIGERSLDRMLASLPALGFVRLHFRPIKKADLTEADERLLGATRVQRNDFPQGLLRWVLPLHLHCHKAVLEG